MGDNPSLYSVAIFVHDIGRAVEFYRDKLRLPMTKHGSFGAEFLDQAGAVFVAVPLERAFAVRRTEVGDRDSRCEILFRLDLRPSGADIPRTGAES